MTDVQDGRTHAGTVRKRRRRWAWAERFPRRHPGLAGFGRRFLQNKMSVAALVVLLCITAAVVLAPLLATHDPLLIDTSKRFEPASTSHWLGTDRMGRDVLSRLLHGGRASLAGAALAVTVAMVLAVPTGIAAGYWRGKPDWVLSRIADVLMTFPTVIFALAVIAVFGPGLVKAMVTLGVIFAPRLFRVVRGATLAVRAETYIEASVCIGTSPLQIMRKRVVPNVLPPLLVQLSITAATALLVEASLSFLGLGVVAPNPSWGVELGLAFLDVHSAPHAIWPAGLLIGIATLALNIVGDGLRDAVGAGSGARA